MSDAPRVPSRERHWFDRTWGRRLVVSTLVSLLLASVVMSLFLWNSRLGGAGRPVAERFRTVVEDGGDLPRLWAAPSFSLVDQHAERVTLDALRGEPFIADFIFTQCTAACPMLTSRMVRLQHELGGTPVRFVSFSVDPAHDTPDVLLAYASKWNARETRWKLLSTSDETLAQVASGFRVAAEKSTDESNPIRHTESFILVDAEGVVRNVYAGYDDEALDRLAADARHLVEGPSVAPKTSAPEARDLYGELGCAGCHENPRLAPPLVNLRGAERMLVDGSKVTVDDAYLRRAVVEPSAEVVNGYNPIMPSYRKVLDDAQLTALIADLESRQAAVPSPDQKTEIFVDPVCQMKVRAVPDAPHVTHDGRDVYFCSEMCRDEFVKNPKRFPMQPVAHDLGR